MKYLFYKVQPLFRTFMAKPPTIRPQVCSAKNCILSNDEFEHFKPTFEKERNDVLAECGSCKTTKKFGP
jgi:hypothetical protein